ncbi:MAG: hypothetical protein WD875_13825 [Pirellulales bacterium]
MTNSTNGKRGAPAAFVALKRAAKAALNLARQTGTGCYVERDGKIVDIARTKPSTAKKRRSPTKRK